MCVSVRRALCLLPVVLMPPTVQELQGRRVGYLLCLYPTAPSFPTISLSLPPADCANSYPVALIHLFPCAKHMQTYAVVSESIQTLVPSAQSSVFRITL